MAARRGTSVGRVRSSHFLRAHPMAVVASIGMGSAGAQPGGAQLSQQDRTFLTQNAQTDQAKIMTGQLAAQRGSTPEIRQTGQMLMAVNFAYNPQDPGAATETAKEGRYAFNYGLVFDKGIAWARDSAR